MKFRNIPYRLTKCSVVRFETFHPFFETIPLFCEKKTDPFAVLDVSIVEPHHIKPAIPRFRHSSQIYSPYWPRICFKTAEDDRPYQQVKLCIPFHPSLSSRNMRTRKEKPSSFLFLFSSFLDFASNSLSSR